jgi:hypothetical protein
VRGSLALIRRKLSVVKADRFVRLKFPLLSSQSLLTTDN